MHVWIIGLRVCNYTADSKIVIMIIMPWHQANQVVLQQGETESLEVHHASGHT